MARTPAPKGDTESPSPRVVGQVRLPPHFTMVFYTTAGLTVLCLLLSGGLAIAGPNTDAAKEVVNGCLTMAKIGFGAIVGLIGGRAL